MARIDPPSRPGLAATASRWYARRRYGSDLAPTAVWAHRTGLMLGYGALEFAFERSGKVDGRLKLLAELKAGAIAGCEWCMDFGSMLSRQEGITERELVDLPRYRESDAFSELDKLVLDYAVAVSRTPVDVPDDLFERLREHFDEAQLVELTTAIALENFRARFNWALGVESQGFMEGGVCAVPERLPA
jgi:AhpD family alkylhydroperoxidase